MDGAAAKDTLDQFSRAHPNLYGLFLLDQQGEQVASTGLDPGQFSGRSPFIDAVNRSLKLGEPGVSNALMTPDAKVIALTMPVRAKDQDAGEPIGVIGSLLSVDRLAAAVLSPFARGDTLIAVIADGEVVAAQGEDPAVNALLGATVSPQTAGKPGNLTYTDETGQERYAVDGARAGYDVGAGDPIPRLPPTCRTGKWSHVPSLRSPPPRWSPWPWPFSLASWSRGHCASCAAGRKRWPRVTLVARTGAQWWRRNCRNWRVLGCHGQPPRRAATRRTACTISAGGVSLSRKPPAPARSARSTCSSASKVVSTSTSGGSRRGAQRLGGGQPVHPGHPDVHQHHVRGVRGDGGGHLGAVGGLADHPRSGAPPRIIDSPARTSASSSTISTRTGRRCAGGRSRRAGHAGHGSQAASRKSPACVAAVVQPAAGQADPLGDARPGRCRRRGSGAGGGSPTGHAVADLHGQAVARPAGQPPR